MQRNILHRTVAITNQRGLHARAAAKFVTCASKFKANIHVSRDGQEVSGQSIMGLMMLAAVQGSCITITARGADAKAAMNALVTLIENKFGEE